MRKRLGTMGEVALLAIAAPFIAADAVRDVRRAGEDVAHLRGLLDRALGELGEARDTRESAMRAHSALVSEICKLDRKIAIKDGVLSGLADELKIALRERDGYRADVDALNEAHTFTAQALETVKSELDGYKRALDASGDVLGKVQAERDAADARATKAENERDALRQVVADHRARVAAKDSEPRVALCEWCLGPAEGSCATTSADVNGTPLMLCREHWTKPYPHTRDIRARVAARLASCPTRRTSPDPLAAECTFGCGALAGEPCKVAS